MRMIALIAVAAALSGCATLREVRGKINCENAAKVREAAAATIAAVDYACPVPVEPVQE